jgi:antitoxin CcdA
MMRIGLNMKPARLASHAAKIPQVCEQGLREEIHMRKEQRWNAQHAAFIAAYNGTVEAEGVALQEWRAF